MECLGIILYSVILIKFDQLFDVIVWFVYVSFGLVLSFIDFKYLRLPNVLTYPFVISVLLLALYNWGQTGQVKLIATPIISGLICLIFYLLLRVISKGGLGFGDIKLAPSIGIVCGFYSYTFVAYSTYLGFFLAGIVSVILLITKKANRKTPIPLGPFMLVSPLLLILAF
jgi:leader peptidase (prepilin peptidase)/N-methyltransferase